MKLEGAIQQQKFNNVHQKMLINVLYTASWLEDITAEILRRRKLSNTQFNVLRILRGSYPSPCTAQDIQERMINKRSDVTRLIERLRKMSLVTRDVCPSNRRKVDILISDKGLDLLKELDPEMEDLGKIFKALNKEEAQQLSDLLDKLRSH
jgi:DNA-binding MarR family transcriptional regulator